MKEKGELNLLITCGVKKAQTKHTLIYRRNWLPEWVEFDGSSRKVATPLFFQPPLLDCLPLEDILARYFGFSGHFQASIKFFTLVKFFSLSKIKTFWKFVTKSFGEKMWHALMGGYYVLPPLVDSSIFYSKNIDVFDYTAALHILMTG